MDEIEIRSARHEDIENVTDFVYRALNDSELLPVFAQDVGEDFKVRLQQENTIILAVEKESETIVGFVEYDPKRSNEKADYLCGLYVLPNYRGVGVGKRLVNTMRDQRRAMGKQLRVEAINDKEKNLWQKFGFGIHHYSLFME